LPTAHTVNQAASVRWCNVRASCRELLEGDTLKGGLLQGT
jgi:hypothetical protein